MSLIVAIALSCSGIARQGDGDADAALRRGMDQFVAGRVAESVATFDRVIELAPRRAPDLWQRGIALYYLDRFTDCRAQFEIHRTVNPADVENPAWHYLCVARAENPARARAALLPVGEDPRQPMRQIYQMFAGKATPDSVIAAGAASPSGRFYAALYVGLYYEAQGDTARARTSITQAASDEFTKVTGYMSAVAKVHVQVRGWGR